MKAPPPAPVKPWEIASFHHLPSAEPLPRYCQGLACFAGKKLDPARWEKASQQEPRLYCLGKCFRAPASVEDSDEPTIASITGRPVLTPTLLGNSGGGFFALERARRLSPPAIVMEIEASGLRGRGGAGFPAGKKWRAVYEAKAPSKVVIVNADEGDPGAYIDRFLLERNPHGLLEALAIAGTAVGAEHGVIYLRREYPKALAVLSQALAESAAALAPFSIEIVVGQGGYVCGEETALLNAIEGKRPEVRVRPPYPSTSGLYGHPTLIHNVETLANVPWIVEFGAKAYRSLGFSQSRGTKFISLNSLFNRPGLYEIEFGLPLRAIVETIGGGLRDGSLKGLIIGGPIAGIVPPHLLDTPFGFEELQAIGAAVGHGGIVAIDDRTRLRDLIEHVFSFGAYESCGKCTPCRLGASRLAEMNWERAEFLDIVGVLKKTSLCGLGSGLAEFAGSILRHYREAFETECCRST